MRRIFQCAAILLVGFVTILWFDFTSSAQANEKYLCEREMIAASEAEKVPLGVLYAVALTETGRGGLLHAYALNIEGQTVVAESAQEAVTHFRAARRKGKKLIDLGCMQINHYYHGAHFQSVQDMLDPRRNVFYAARFLRQLEEREGSWSMAVARYHAGPSNEPAQKRYICAVISNLAETGFGTWTPASRQFCVEYRRSIQRSQNSARRKR